MLANMNDCLRSDQKAAEIRQGDSRHMHEGLEGALRGLLHEGGTGTRDYLRDQYAAGSGSIGLGQKYVVPETASGAGSTFTGLVGGPQGQQYHQPRDLHGSDSADLRHFEPGEPHRLPGGSGWGHSNTFDHPWRTRAELGRGGRNEQLRKDSYIYYSDSQPSQVASGQRSMDNRGGSSRRAMINQAVHRYDSAMQQAERACRKAQYGEAIKRRGSDRDSSAGEQRSLSHMHQHSKTQPGHPVSILKKKSPSFAEESGSKGRCERDRGQAPQQNFGIKLMPTQLEVEAARGRAQGGALQHSHSPHGYQYQRGRKNSEGSHRSASVRSQESRHRWPGRNARSPIGDPNRYDQQRLPSASSPLFAGMSDHGLIRGSQERQNRRLDHACESPAGLGHLQSHQELRRVPTTGSDLDDTDHRHLYHHPRAVAGSKTQDFFGREQHEALVRSMNEQIKRQHDRDQERVQRDGLASRKDGRSLSTHKEWLESHKDNYLQEGMQDEIRRRERQLRQDRRKLMELETATMSRELSKGRARDFRDILSTSFDHNFDRTRTERTLSVASRGSRGNPTRFHGSGRIDGASTTNFTKPSVHESPPAYSRPYDPLDHDLSKFERGVCPLRYNVTDQEKLQEMQTQYNRIPEEEIRARATDIKDPARTPQILAIEKRAHAKLRHLSEENRRDTAISNREIGMQDKIRKLRMEFDVMFSPRDQAGNRPGKSDKRYQSISFSYDDLPRVKGRGHLQNTGFLGGGRDRSEGQIKDDEQAERLSESAALRQGLGAEAEMGNGYGPGQQPRFAGQALHMPTRILGVQNIQIQKSKSVCLDRHQSHDDLQDASFQSRIRKLSNTFLGQRSKSIVDDVVCEQQQAHSRAPAHQLMLDATKLKYSRGDLDGVTHESPDLASRPQHLPISSTQRPSSPQSCHRPQPYFVEEQVPSPAKSTIHQAFSKAPSITHKNRLDDTGDTTLNDSQHHRHHQMLCSKIRQNKERLRRLLLEDGKLSGKVVKRSKLRSVQNNQQRHKKHHSAQMTSFPAESTQSYLVSQESRRGSAELQAVNNQNKSPQHANLRNMQAGPADQDAYVNQSNQHYPPESKQSRPSHMDSRQPDSSADNRLDHTSQSSWVQRAPSPIIASASNVKGYDRRNSSQHQVHDSKHVQKVQARISPAQAALLRNNRNRNISERVTKHIKSMYLRPNNGGAGVGGGVQPPPRAGTFQQQQAQLTQTSKSASMNTMNSAALPPFVARKYVPNADLMQEPLLTTQGGGAQLEEGTIGMTTGGGQLQSVVESNGGPARSTLQQSAEYTLMKSEVLSLKEEVLCLQAKLIAKENAKRAQTSAAGQNNGSNQEAAKTAAQPGQDVELEQIEQIKLKYHHKYKLKYEKRQNEERIRNQETIDCLKVELQNIQLKYGKRVAKLENEIKVKTEKQMQDLEQRYKDREQKMKGKYEKKLIELREQLQHRQQDSIEKVQQAQIEREVKLGVEEVARVKDAQLKVANQRIQLLENLINLNNANTTSMKEGSNVSTQRLLGSPSDQPRGSTQPATTAADSARRGSAFLQTSQNGTAAGWAHCKNESVLSEQFNNPSLLPDSQVGLQAPRGTSKQSSGAPTGSLPRHQRSKSMTFQGPSNLKDPRKQQQCLFQNQTLKALDKAMQDVELAASPKVAGNDRVALQQIINQMQKHNTSNHDKSYQERRQPNAQVSRITSSARTIEQIAATFQASPASHQQVQSQQNHHSKGSIANKPKRGHLQAASEQIRTVYGQNMPTNRTAEAHHQQSQRGKLPSQRQPGTIRAQLPNQMRSQRAQRQGATTQKENVNSQNQNSHGFQNAQGGAADPRRGSKARPLPKASQCDHPYQNQDPQTSARTEQQNNTTSDCAGDDPSSRSGGKTGLQSPPVVSGFVERVPSAGHKTEDKDEMMEDGWTQEQQSEQNTSSQSHRFNQ